MRDIAELRKQADAGDGHSAFLYGLLQLKGELMYRKPINISLAESYICKARNLGDPVADEFLKIYESV